MSTDTSVIALNAGAAPSPADISEAAVCIKQFGNVFRAFQHADAVLRMLQGFHQAEHDHNRRLSEFAESRRTAGRAEAQEIVDRARHEAAEINRTAQEKQKQLTIEVRDLRAEASKLRGELAQKRTDLEAIENKIAAARAALGG